MTPTREPGGGPQEAAVTAAYLADGRPVGREAFYAIACNPSRSVVVEACAGAGKTWLLVSRIVRALLDGAQPHEILAITFTRKAAGEMQERLQQWLREHDAAQATPRARVQALRERGLDEAAAMRLEPAFGALRQRLLLAPRPVEIRTFHGWFSQLLRAAPLELLAELGLPAGGELIENLEDLQDELFRRFHATLLRDAGLRSDYTAAIAARGRSQVARWLGGVVERGTEFALADAAGTLEASVSPADALWPELAGLDSPAQLLTGAAWQARLGELAAALGPGGAKARKAADLLIDALQAPDADQALGLATRALFTDTGTPRKGLGAAPLLDAVVEGLQRIQEQTAQQAAHLEHARMVRLSRCLLQQLGALKRERGLIDMADLERCALALLRDSTLAGWVQQRLDQRFRHVLVDEFQDTSPLQWQALHAWLGAYAGAGGGASGQQPPSVFVVGDPKQSIYRFRRAEPRVFAAAREFVVQGLGGSLLACDHTRRNAPAVLEAVNTLFAQARDEGGFDGFRTHTTEVPAGAAAGVGALPVSDRVASSRSGAAPPFWRDSLTVPRREPEEVLREHEARRVAAAVAGLIAAEGFAPGEFMVLCRKRQSLRLVAQALRDLRLPFAEVEELALMETPEARDMVALLDALVSPSHRLSLAQALRCPLFGATDDELVALANAARAAGDGDWWAALVRGAHDTPALQRAQGLLPAWREAARRLPPHDLLDLVVAQGGWRERLAAAVPAAARGAALDALDAVLAQALALNGGRYATPYALVRALRSGAVKFSPPPHPDAVQLLTVHAAKGLEARAVFVLDADPQPRNADSATLLIDWPVDAPHPLRLAFVYSETRCPAELAPLLASERAARQREELNGLYVAMTRARERLVFSATPPSRREPACSWWQRALPHAAAMAEPAQPPVDHPAAVAATLWALPGPRTPWPPARAEAAEAPAAAATAASQLGQAVHRALEWATRAASAQLPHIGALAAAAATEFGADATEVQAVTLRILNSPQCARFFDASGLRWAGNEIDVGDAGKVLRIDRLVAVEEGGQTVWWVLDYKLHPRPHELPAYREQLLGYRSLVARAQPLDPVRCAFITGDGEVFEVPAGL
jgi:ATP-dependent helicase/nuclease subunit A